MLTLTDADGIVSQVKFRQAQSLGPDRLFIGLTARLALATCLAAAAFGAEAGSPCARAEAGFLAARAAWNAAPDNATNAWRFARAAFDHADCAAADRQRAAIAEEAIRACRAAVAHDPRSAPAHYYLAQNLGQLARTKSLGALKLVREMEKTWLRAQELDEAFDHAGPDRSLGLLYRDAPGWPTSLGSNAKSRAHLERAVKLAPDFPENRLCFAETLLHWKKRDELAAQLKALDALWPRAKAQFTGDEWATAWPEWEARRTALRKRVGQVSQ